MNDRKASGERWASIIEAKVDDPTIARNLILSLRRDKPVIEDIVKHWSGKKKTRQSQAQARDELAGLYRSVIDIESTLDALGDTAREQILQAARSELLGSGVPAVILRDDYYENPMNCLAETLRMYARIFGTSARTMESRARISHHRDEIRDFAVRSVAMRFRLEAPDLGVSQKPTSVFHKVTEEYLGDLGLYDSNLRRSIERLISEGNLKS